jgi:hypothetical protein
LASAPADRISSALLVISASPGLRLGDQPPMAQSGLPHQPIGTMEEFA